MDTDKTVSRFSEDFGIVWRIGNSEGLDFEIGSEFSFFRFYFVERL